MNIGTSNSTKASVQAPLVMAAPGLSKKESSPGVGQSGAPGSADNEHLIRMVEEIRVQLESVSVSLEFTTYGEHGEKIAVVVTNKESGEVIREIPSEELQSLYSKMREVNGIIFNTQV